MSREEQKERWEDRKAKRRRYGLNIREKKPTKKGESKGAFGICRHILDPRPALRPAAMKAHAEEMKKKRLI